MKPTISTDPVLQVLGRGIELVERGECAKALPIFATVYKSVSFERYPQGLSAYGLCLSRIERKNKLGAELCERAMLMQPSNGLHRANLVRLYAAAKNRRKAIEVLERGLGKVRQDAKLLKVRDEIGWRKSPSLRFLRRTNPINKLYSHCARILLMPVRMSAVLALLRLG